MDRKQILTLFFKAENERDWKTYRKYLSPDIVWELHSKEKIKIKGRACTAYEAFCQVDW